MIHEMRVYELRPGRLKAFLKRFEEVSIPFFEKHGIRLVGCWKVGELPEATEVVTAGGRWKPAAGTRFDSDRVAYMVAFESIAARDRAWESFVHDPEWPKALDAAEPDGRSVAGESFLLLDPATFSPMHRLPEDR